MGRNVSLEMEYILWTGKKKFKQTKFSDIFISSLRFIVVCRLKDTNLLTEQFRVISNANIWQTTATTLKLENSNCAMQAERSQLFPWTNISAAFLYHYQSIKVNSNCLSENSQREKSVFTYKEIYFTSINFVYWQLHKW